MHRPNEFHMDPRSQFNLQLHINPKLRISPKLHTNPRFQLNLQLHINPKLPINLSVYVDDLLQQFNDVRETYGISGSEDKIGNDEFWVRIIQDQSKVTPPEALGELNDLESRCHIGTTDPTDRTTDPTDKSKWVYLRYCMETRYDVQENWRFEKHFREPVERSMMTFLPTLDAVAAKSMVLKHIDWWQKQAYMGYYTEQILCAARRRMLKKTFDRDHLDAEDVVVLSELKLASQHFSQCEHYSEEDNAVLELVIRQSE
ncbi:hypothetical protein ACHAQD_003432 [Fusarium lateritium]